METPTMMAATYGNSVGQVFGGMANMPYTAPEYAKAWTDQVRQIAAREAQKAAINTVTTTSTDEEPMSERRLVRVVMVDPNEDVPTESALLYDSKEIFTDKTDQELYFDMPIADILKSHNEKRTKIIDKTVKERTEYLEPARIRDLKMLVLTLAKF